MVRQIPDRKLLPCSVYDTLTQIANYFNSRFIVSRQTLAVAAQRVLCRPGVTHLS